MHRVRVRCVVAVLMVVLSALAGVVADVAARPDREGLKAGLDARVLRLRPWAGTCRTFYTGAADSCASVTFLPGAMIPVRPGSTIKVGSVLGNAETGFRVRFQDRRNRMGVFLLRPTPGSALSDRDVEQLLSIILLGDGEQDIAPQLEGIRDGRIVHLPFSNHGPAPGERESFASLDQARAAGRRPCPSCFHEIPEISGILEELQIGRETEQAVRYRYPVVVDAERQRHLQEIGESVASDWPLPLKGYHYRFTLVESDELNAFACPGGAVFLTSAMYDASESDAELRTCLAHEIAHVELRHGYRQYRSARTASMVSSLLAAVAVGVIAKYGGSDLAMATAQVIANIGAAIVLTGYEREHEIEADAFACVYSERKFASREPFARVLRKLQFAENARGFDEQVSAFSSHPEIASRIASASRASIAAFDSTDVFTGYDREGVPVVVARLESQGHYERLELFESRPRSISEPSSGASRSANTIGIDYRHKHDYRVYVTFRSLGVLVNPVQWRAIELQTEAGVVLLENSEKTEMGPYDEVGTAFTTDKKQELIGSRVVGIRTPLVTEVAYWVRADQ